jgi:6-pyruvoyltetrahydropterin/6-carboxytetrahydropterin synthase
MKASIIRKETFNSAHRLFLDEWSEAKNLEVFGKCSYPHFHGHNYDLHLKVTGDIDPKTGFVYDVAELKQIIKEEVTHPFDHRNLNLDTTEFKDLIPTVENIAKVIYHKIRKRIAPAYEIKVTLYETPRNYCEFPA